MKVKYLVIAITVIIIGFLFFAIFPKNQTPKTTEIDRSETPNPNTVIYSNSGYSPLELIIPVGTTVSFVNQSDLPMWTASNPHPVHTDFAEFDQRKGVRRGESYEFTFEKSGTYDYHNHLSPQHGAKIIVE